MKETTKETAKETTKETAYEKFEQLTPEQQALVLAWMDDHAN